MDNQETIKHVLKILENAADSPAMQARTGAYIGLGILAAGLTIAEEIKNYRLAIPKSAYQKMTEHWGKDKS